RFGFDLNLPFLQPHPHPNRRDARGPRSKGTEILTGVLEATVRDPPGRAPAPRLKCGFAGPKLTSASAGDPSPFSRLRGVPEPELGAQMKCPVNVQFDTNLRNDRTIPPAVDR